MAKYYLHKQTFVIALICVLAVGTATAYTYVKPSSPTTENIIVEKEISNTESEPIASDVDWKKQFFSQSSSTEGTTGNSDESSTVDNEPITLTNQFSRELFARFIDLKKNGLDGNEKLVNGAIEETIYNGINSIDQAKHYEMSDLTIANQISADVYRNYGNNIGLIMMSYMPKTSAPMILNDALDRNNMALLNNIDSIITSYEKSTKELLGTSVPALLAQNHLDLINSIQDMIFVSRKMKAVETDPLQSMVSIGTYVKAENAFFSSLNKMKDYLSSQKIAFNTNESGIFFSKISQ